MVLETTFWAAATKMQLLSTARRGIDQMRGRVRTPCMHRISSFSQLWPPLHVENGKLEIMVQRSKRGLLAA